MTPTERVEAYLATTGYPRSLFVGDDGRIYGTWVMGQAYGVQTGYYGGYPAGYLRRVAALFPDKQAVLHLFSGKVNPTILPGDTVDVRAELSPTFVVDATSLVGVPVCDYDLVLADPPYSVEDADHYGPPMVNRNKVLAALCGLRPGAHVVWLDQVLPMYRKVDWKTIGYIGMVKSTSHRFRMITVFERIGGHPKGEVMQDDPRSAASGPLR